MIVKLQIDKAGRDMPPGALFHSRDHSLVYKSINPQTVRNARTVLAGRQFCHLIGSVVNGAFNVEGTVSNLSW